MADKTILEGTAQASYNGIPFFVKNSSIKFGQKNIVHQYGESNRTEVEHNGLAEDEFVLELMVYGTGEDYYAKRNALKTELSRKAIKAGTLRHPFESKEIKCKVVGRPELTETFTELGIAYFSVTFQKCSEKIYPVVSDDNTAQLAEGLANTLSQVETSVANMKVSSNFVNSYQETSGKITSISDVFNAAQRKVSILTSSIDKISSTILKFRNNVNRFIALPAQLASSLTGLFNTVLFVTSKPFDSLNYYKEFFNFGDDDKLKSDLTVENKEINRNKRILNNAVKVNSLALCYGSLSGIDFDNQDELDATRSLLNNQYDDIYEDLDFDIRNSLANLNALANAYLDSLDVDRIVDYHVNLAPLSAIVYNLYGNFDKYAKISTVNKFDNNVVVEGDIKIIADK